MKHLATYGGIYLLVAFFYVMLFWVFPTLILDHLPWWRASAAAHVVLGCVVWAAVGIADLSLRWKETE